MWNSLEIAVRSIDQGWGGLRDTALKETYDLLARDKGRKLVVTVAEVEEIEELADEMENLCTICANYELCGWG